MSSSENLRNRDSAAAGANVVLFVCWSWATAIEVFLHKNFGSRYLGLQALAVLILVPLFGLAWERYDLIPLVLFLPAYLLMVIVARIGVLWRYWRGESCHSMYTGWPRGLKSDARLTELQYKRFVEPLLALAVGYILYQFLDAPLGAFIMCGAVCLAITVNVDLAVARVRAARLNDAVIEQQQLARRFRQMQGRH